MSYTDNIIPTMTADNAPSGLATGGIPFGAYARWKAFDHLADSSHGWMHEGGASWLQYQFPETHVITRYAVTSFPDAAPPPKTWTFKGSNDGATWTTLDTQTNITDWAALGITRKVFDIANATTYAYYKLDISASNNDGWAAVGELEMMETVVVLGDFPASSGSIALAGSADILGFFAVVGMDASGAIDIDGIAGLTIAARTYVAAVGTIALTGYADLDQWESMAATGSVSLGGEAWLSAVIHGDDTLAAIGTIELRGAVVRLSTGESLPATDDLGWTAPDVTTPDLRGLLVSVGGLSVKRAQITDLVIELDTEGGPKSATLSVNCELTRAPKLMQTLEVTYKGQILFPKKGRLENISSNVDSSTGYTLTYAGPLVTLRDHKAFRTVYVDSDLDNWSTDQGPRTSPDTFSGITAGSA